MDQSLLADVVDRWSRFASLSDEDRRAIGALPVTERTFERESYLIREGQPTTHCTLLRSGFAYRHKLVRNGARQIISIHIPGEFVDLQNAMFEIADHNVQCLTRVEVLLIRKQALNDIIADRPNVRRVLWLDTLIDASIFREWVVNVGRRNARARIAHLLCELILRIRQTEDILQTSWDIPLTQEQMADAVGLTPVHTNRTLKSLREDGVITFEQRKLRVIDWDKLVKVGEFNERYLHHELARRDDAQPTRLVSDAG